MHKRTCRTCGENLKRGYFHKHASAERKVALEYLRMLVDSDRRRCREAFGGQEGRA